MSMYNLLFGKNPQSALLLAVIGFKENDIERFRDVAAEDDGNVIRVHTRTGGGNRSAYPNVDLYKSPLFVRTEDDDFDSTYADFYFRVPSEFVSDVSGLSDIMANGLRKEFCDHIAKTLRREQTDSDLSTAAYEAEAAALARTSHVMANGHTFVPHDDWAMREALKIAEANGGKLRTAWGIMPLQLSVKRDYVPYPGIKGIEAQFIRRLETSYDWTIDKPYWDHCQEFFAGDFPVTMAEIKKSVDGYLAKEAAGGSR